MWNLRYKLIHDFVIALLMGSLICHPVMACPYKYLAGVKVTDRPDFTKVDEFVGPLRGTKDIYEALKDEPLTFEKTISAILAQVPVKEGAWLRETLKEIQNQQIKIEEDPGLAFNRAGLKLEGSLFRPLKTKPTEKAVIVWPAPRKIRNQQELDDAIASAIDIAAKVRYTPVRWLTIYKNNTDTFIGKNLVALQEKLRLQFYTLSEEGRGGWLAVPLEIYNFVKSFMMSPLPLHYNTVDRINLNGVHRSILERVGSKGLFAYLVATQGAGVAVRYWGQHLANIGVVLGLALLVHLTPTTEEIIGDDLKKKIPPEK